MRLLPWLSSALIALAISLALASTANARHFWQTYGSTMPAADGCGCTWNWNFDYFVPRHPSSCRYELFSPCKSSCTTSPACKWCHPFHPGYCGIYGPCHYHRRNHVYGCRCGCTPIPFCLRRSCSNQSCSCHGGEGSCVAGCTPKGCAAPMCSEAGDCTVGNTACCEPVAPLYHVEPRDYAILGSIPVDSSELLTRTDLSQLGGAGGQLLLQPQGLLDQLPAIPSLQNITSPQPSNSP